LAKKTDKKSIKRKRAQKLKVVKYTEEDHKKAYLLSVAGNSLRSINKVIGASIGCLLNWSRSDYKCNCGYHGWDEKRIELNSRTIRKTKEKLLEEKQIKDEQKRIDRLNSSNEFKQKVKEKADSILTDSEKKESEHIVEQTVNTEQKEIEKTVNTRNTVQEKELNTNNTTRLVDPSEDMLSMYDLEILKTAKTIQNIAKIALRDILYKDDEGNLKIGIEIENIKDFKAVADVISIANKEIRLTVGDPTEIKENRSTEIENKKYTELINSQEVEYILEAIDGGIDK